MYICVRHYISRISDRTTIVKYFLSSLELQQVMLASSQADASGLSGDIGSGSGCASVTLSVSVSGAAPVQSSHSWEDAAGIPGPFMAQVWNQILDDNWDGLPKTTKRYVSLGSGLVVHVFHISTASHILHISWKAWQWTVGRWRHDVMPKATSAA